MDQRGGVLVMVALWLPLLVLVLVFAIDVGNWFVHKRHLQMQADAGALAAAREFNACPNDAPIRTKAAEYSQDLYNAQIGGTPPTRVRRLINSKTFYNQPTDPDDTVEADPCSAGMVDVKLTETDLPWYFKPVAALLGDEAKVPYINAQARVSVFQKETAQGALPVGVPDINPKSARAWFVNEKTGAVLGSTALSKTGTSNGLVIWDNAGAPLPVTVDAADTDVGVVVALGGGTSTTCGQPLVDCYDAGAPAAASGLPSKGVLYVRGWSAAGSGAQPANDPILRQATLINGTCVDPYFSSATANCTIGVQASVDFGAADPATVGAELTATIAGTTRTLNYDAATQLWTSPTTFTLAPGAGPVDVTLDWAETTGTLHGNTCNKAGNNPCKGSFGVVQRAFSATDARSGPIQLAHVIENGAQWANSLERCSAAQTSCTHEMVVRIGVKGNLENATDVDDPVVVLRVAGTGSQTQSVDCDPGKQLREELATGCSPTYAVNQGTACPESPVPAIAHCVPVETGAKIGHVASGLIDRVFNGSDSCAVAPNNWSSYPNLPAGDPRIIQVFLTPFGTFQGNGNASVPVIGFATFYLTGFNGSPCQGQGEDTVPGKGDIAGHFIKYVDSLNPGSGTAPCDFASLGSCTAVMTR
jgi:hypothetical protein